MLKGILIAIAVIALQVLDGINSYGDVKFFCSKFGQEKKVWKDAKKTCNDAGLQMAMPRTKAELDHLRELCNVYPLPHVHLWWTKSIYNGGNPIQDLLVWIGGSSPGHGKDYKMFKYENGKVVPEFLYFPGAPDNLMLGSQLCLGANTYIDNYFCYRKMRYACEKRY